MSGASGFNRLEDKFKLAFAGLSDMLGRSDAARQRQQQSGAAPAASVLRGPSKPEAGRRDGPIGRILEDLVHFNNNLTPTAKDPALWWHPADSADAVGTCVTFGELNGRVNFLARCLARTLRAHGCNIVDGAGAAALCVVMPCGPDRLALELAALKLGLPLLGLELSDGGEELGRLLAALQSSTSASSTTVALVASSGAAARLPELRSLAPSLALALQFDDLAEAGRTLGLSDRDLQDEERPSGVADADSAAGAVAFIVETLGGRLVSLTQGQLLAAASWLRDTLPWQCHEVLWLGDSCDSAYWRVHALSALLHGIPLLLCPGCARWDAWLKLVRTHYATRLVASPSFLADLLCHTANRPSDRAQLASVETVLVIGEPLSPRIADEFYRQLGAGRTLGCLYSSAEACGAAAYGIYRCPADVAESRQLSNWLLALTDAAPNVRLAVTDGRGRPLPAGELGEIRLRLLDGNAEDNEDSWTSALRTGDVGQLVAGRLLCFGRLTPDALDAVEAAASVGWRLRAASDANAGGLLLMAQAAAPAPVGFRRFSTASLLSRLSPIVGKTAVGLLSDWSEMPRRRLWELPDLRAVQKPVCTDGSQGAASAATAAESGGKRVEADAPDDDDGDAWTAAARQLVEAASAPASSKHQRLLGGGCSASGCRHRLSRLLNSPDPVGGLKAWQSHLPDTEAAYRMEGPDFTSGIGSFRLLDRSGRVAALVEFRLIDGGIAGAAADAADAGFDSAACAAALRQLETEQQHQAGKATIAETRPVCRVVRVRYPSSAGGRPVGGAGGSVVRALRFLRLADLAEHLLLHCAQLLGCTAAVRIADDVITQALCQELHYQIASTRQLVSLLSADSISNGFASRSSGSSRSSSVSSSGGGGSRGRGQAWEAATVSELHAQCRSQTAVLLVRRVPRLTDWELA